MADYIEENNLGNPAELPLNIAALLFGFFSFVVAAIISAFIPNFIALAFGVGAGLFAVWCGGRVMKFRFYREIATLKTPVFITSLHRGDCTVFERYQQAQADIAAAWVADPNRPVPPVYVLYWGEGGESDGEYWDRKDFFKIERTKAYHEAIIKKNHSYYIAVILGQKGATYQAVNN
jgi:hypothetical protein